MIKSMSCGFQPARCMAISALLHGVVINKRIATTYSVVMRAHSRTVRYVKAFHDLDLKTIRLASKGAHVRL